MGIIKKLFGGDDETYVVHGTPDGTMTDVEPNDIILKGKEIREYHERSGKHPEHCGAEIAADIVSRRPRVFNTKERN
ncbi:hypothetical protein IPM62_01520 [Candidatus Woesebacteria bacterium]|nr:MAG: hypothetical protein IPM62_01520 [Candidatus Woesebacteria bacterium]